MQLLQTLSIFIKLTEFLHQTPLPTGWPEIWSDQLGMDPSLVSLSQGGRAEIQEMKDSVAILV